MILIADDDAHIVASLRAVLTREGYEVEGAANGVEAYRVVKSPRCRFLFLDVGMPEMDGLELLSLMESEHINVPTAVMTGREDFRPEALNPFACAVELLRKPFDLNAAVRVVKRHLEKTIRVSAWTTSLRVAGSLSLRDRDGIEGCFADPFGFVELKDAVISRGAGTPSERVPRVLLRSRSVEAVVPEPASQGVERAQTAEDAGNG